MKINDVIKLHIKEVDTLQMNTMVSTVNLGLNTSCNISQLFQISLIFWDNFEMLLQV